MFNQLAFDRHIEYNYDESGRILEKRIEDAFTGAISTESFAYDAAGNMTQSSDAVDYEYDPANRLVSFNYDSLEYDAAGNLVAMVADVDPNAFTYDSRNRLISAGNMSYEYDPQDLRTKSTCNGVETTYAYNPHAPLSQLLMKTTGNVTTKYVYGLGLIGEETGGEFKTYHYDYRGSTVAITDEDGEITDTFEYDTYGKLLSHTGTTDTPFLYNGRDGVMTEPNGLYYMRNRYYSPDLRRFISADIIPGDLTNAITLNRYAYANNNPIMNVDSLGLSAERGGLGDKQENTVNEYVLLLTTHDENRRPNEGEPGSTWEAPNGDKRTYGPDGKPAKDYDHNDHGYPNTHPHDENGGHNHDWNDGVRGPAYVATVKTVFGVAIVIISLAGMAYIVGNDATGVGVADDGLLIFLATLLAKGARMVS